MLLWCACMCSLINPFTQKSGSKKWKREFKTFIFWTSLGNKASLLVTVITYIKHGVLNRLIFGDGFV